MDVKEKKVDESKDLLPHEEVTIELSNNKNVNFCIEGFDQSKRYINIDLFEDRAKYWKFVYDHKINNIVLLEDRFNEKMVYLLIDLLN